ncbi:signal peptidase I [Pseudomonas mangrovi]|uniref:Signal peptidase I n=1 Tax=Pseudomonas mangrovi TaxID=2161748 RepID=A0A2T5PAV4_9PSED|nr:signal peptidase I [Pseudomonas mangrovi]PTU74852.1 signal peptidase I [Pseudomonas mangrovi]
MRIGFWKISAGLLVGLLALYLVNPLGTASHDPRLRLLGIAPFSQPSASMAPTLAPGRLILVSAWAHAVSEPQRGEIVVFLPPEGEAAFVKRLVALPGDRVALKQGRLLVNGETVDEPYLHPAPAFGPRHGQDMAERSLAADEYFMLGDHRDNSKDSRHFGPVGRKAFFGRVEKAF